MLSCGENNRAVVDTALLSDLEIERFRLVSTRDRRILFEGSAEDFETKDPIILENEGDFVSLEVLLGEGYYPLDFTYLKPGIITPKEVETPQSFIDRIKEIAAYAEGKE